MSSFELPRMGYFGALHFFFSASRASVLIKVEFYIWLSFCRGSKIGQGAVEAAMMRIDRGLIDQNCTEWMGSLCKWLITKQQRLMSTCHEDLISHHIGVWLPRNTPSVNSHWQWWQSETPDSCPCADYFLQTLVKPFGLQFQSCIWMGR